MIIVAGATGYIGRYLLPDMKAKGEEVLALGRNKEVLASFEKQGIQTLEFDLLNEDDYDKLPTENVKGIINLTAILAELEVPIDSFWEVNTKGNYMLLEFARKNNIKKFVMASSHKVYNDVDSEGPIDEKTLPSFKGDHSPYIISKIAAENYLQFYSKDYAMDCIALRLTGVRGYGEILGFLQKDGSYTKSACEIFFESALMGKTIEIWGDQSIKRDHVYIKDVVSAFETAINAKEGIRGIYNVASGVGYSQEEEARAIAKVFAGENGESKIELYPEKEGLERGYVYSIEKIKQDMGWEPKYSDIVEFYKDYKKEWERKVYHNYHYVKPEDKPLTF